MHHFYRTRCWLVVAALAALWAVPAAVEGQIYETLCRDANCTDVALGPIALIPQCYSTPLGSASLSINSSESTVVELCFYPANDCTAPAPGETNATRGGSRCHFFSNGEVRVNPFLQGINGTDLYIQFSWDPTSLKLLLDLLELLPSLQGGAGVSRRQLLNNFLGLADFGDWCGPGHGGLSDCCNDRACPECDITQGLTNACLTQCPARDQLDFACAVHDFCTTIYDYRRFEPTDGGFECLSVFGTRQADYCACDCQLVRSAQRVSSTNDLYRSALIFLFTHLSSCWYNTTNGLVCNTGDRQVLVTEFCT